MDGVADSARALVAEIAAALEYGDNEAAADRAADGLAAFPDAAVFHRLHGTALFALGATDEAKEHLAAALAVDPLDNEALIALAGVADMLGDPYTAAEYLLTAWEHDPASQSLRADLTQRLATLYGPEGYLQFTRPALAALYARNAFPIRAEREYHAILAEHPDRLDLRLAAALARWRVGQLAETAATCTALLAEQPQLVRARWALADAMARQGQGEAAREHAKQAARYDPDGGIARELIAMNADAAIVDPDEPIPMARLREAPIPIAETIRPPTEIAAIVADTMSLENPQDVPYVAPAEHAALEATAASADQSPAPVIAMVEEDGQVIATVPGGEPVLDAIDALPTLPPAHAAQRAPAPGLPTQEGGETVGAHSRAPISALPPGIPLPGVPAPVVSTPAVEQAIATARERLAAGDLAGAVAAMRVALQAVGSDGERVRALLPALRALVDAAQRPDAHWLLGDAYRRLGQYTQAEGQYRQALLVRVAGKGTAR